MVIFVPLAGHCNPMIFPVIRGRGRPDRRPPKGSGRLSVRTGPRALPRANRCPFSADSRNLVQGSEKPCQEGIATSQPATCCSTSGARIPPPQIRSTPAQDDVIEFRKRREPLVQGPVLGFRGHPITKHGEEHTSRSVAVQRAACPSWRSLGEAS